MFFSISPQKHNVLGTPQKHSTKLLLKGSHNICFHEEIRKIIFWFKKVSYLETKVLILICVREQGLTFHAKHLLRKLTCITKYKVLLSEKIRKYSKIVSAHNFKNCICSYFNPA